MVIALPFADLAPIQRGQDHSIDDAAEGWGLPTRVCENWAGCSLESGSDSAFRERWILDAPRVGESPGQGLDPCES